MTTAAYFECFAGASGDMILGALVDAGWSEGELRAALEAVPVSGWTLEVGTTKKQALRATQVRIQVTEPQPERTVREIVPMIEQSQLPEPVRRRVIDLFLELASVEGIQHDQPASEVHFHEVGAVDSILDIVGACAGLHALGVERIAVSPINVGGGTVSTRDGILPVPGPAALELLRRKGAPIYASEYGPEFLTPTGALVLATLSDEFGPFPPMRVRRIGYGAGQKDFTIPNVLRLSIGDQDGGARLTGRFWRVPASLGGQQGTQAHEAPTSLGEAESRGHVHDEYQPEHAHEHPHEHDRAGASGHQHKEDRHTRLRAPVEDVVVQLETNVDDMNPEWFGHLTERLLAAGALDVTLTPVQMKKGRPGTAVTVLAYPDRAEPALQTLFAESTTLGVRVTELTRIALPRRVHTVQTPFGAVRVKVALLGGAIRGIAPEYDDCREAAARSGVPLQQVYDAARSAAGPLGGTVLTEG